MNKTQSSLPKVLVEDLGLIDYKEAWEYQTAVHRALIDDKRKHRDDENYVPEHRLLLCEHPAVLTLGKSGKEDHLLTKEVDLSVAGIQYYKINRGGDITYHGPGQLVVYPLLDLEDFYRDVHRYVRSLEDLVIRSLADYGLRAERHEGYTGVWMADKPKRKICAIGVHLSRWVSLHGLALNANPELAHFEHIVPCGISDPDRFVTSIQKELGRQVPMPELKSRILDHFAEVFEAELVHKN